MYRSGSMRKRTTKWFKKGEDMTTQEIIKWTCNPENSGNCAECPYNEGFSNWQDRKPCGQWRCWVDLHTEDDAD